MRRGEPTGITREDLYKNRTHVMYRGRRMRVINRRTEYLPQERITLELDPEDGPCLLLYGYFDGDELMEEDHKFIPC